MPTDIEEISTIEELLKEFFQKLGYIADITPPYLLITPEGKEIDPTHPLNVAKRLRQLGVEIKKNLKRLPSKELLSLTNAATKGLNEFMKGK